MNGGEILNIFGLRYYVIGYTDNSYVTVGRINNRFDDCVAHFVFIGDCNQYFLSLTNVVTCSCFHAEVRFKGWFETVSMPLYWLFVCLILEPQVI